MSRSGYSDDLEPWALICWRGAVKSAIKGRKGQLFLKELLNALDALPSKRLAANSFERSGEFCTLGALGSRRGLDMAPLRDAFEFEPRDVGDLFGIPRALAAEIMFENDQDFCYWKNETPEDRWSRMRNWVESQIAKEPQ